jgi:hypothetical protein
MAHGTALSFSPQISTSATCAHRFLVPFFLPNSIDLRHRQRLPIRRDTLIGRSQPLSAQIRCVARPHYMTLNRMLV